MRYSALDPELPAAFNEAAIPKEGPRRAGSRQLKEAIELGLGLEERVREMEWRNAELEVRMAESEEARLYAQAEIASQRQQIEARAAKRSVPVGTEFNEAETRTHLIDAALTEAGWQPGNRATGGYEAEAKVPASINAG